jgi:hypothetical protein
MERITDAQLEQLLAEVREAVADIELARAGGDRLTSMDDDQRAAIERVRDRLQRVEESLSSLRPLPG